MDIPKRRRGDGQGPETPSIAAEDFASTIEVPNHAVTALVMVLVIVAGAVLTCARTRAPKPLTTGEHITLLEHEVAALERQADSLRDVTVALATRCTGRR